VVVVVAAPRRVGAQALRHTSLLLRSLLTRAPPIRRGRGGGQKPP
jgi:hypothetical protein